MPAHPRRKAFGQHFLKDQALYEKVNKVRDRAAEKFGVNSTPTFFVNGEKYTGEVTLADISAVGRDLAASRAAAVAMWWAIPATVLSLPRIRCRR